MIKAFKKHPVRNTILVIVLAIFLAVGGVLIAQAVAAGTREARMREQLSLGTRYLNEMDYEAALVCFNTVLDIESRNVPAYVGAALASTGLQDNDKAVRILEQGIENTDNGFLVYMKNTAESGQPLLETVELVESPQSAALAADPFSTLKVLGSDYYTWDVNAAAGTFGLDLEENAGKKVDLGSYKGMNMELDATGDDPLFHLTSADYLYEYRFLTASEMQHFLVDCIGDSSSVPAVSEVDWQLKAGTSYQETLSLLGLPDPQENVYTLSDSDHGYIGYVMWKEDGKTNLMIHMAAGRPLGLHLTFTEGGLMTAAYVCDLPENLRSSMLRMTAKVM